MRCETWLTSCRCGNIAQQRGQAFGAGVDPVPTVAGDLSRPGSFCPARLWGLGRCQPALAAVQAVGAHRRCRQPWRQAAGRRPALRPTRPRVGPGAGGRRAPRPAGRARGLCRPPMQLAPRRRRVQHLRRVRCAGSTAARAIRQRARRQRAASSSSRRLAQCQVQPGPTARRGAPRRRAGRPSPAIADSACWARANWPRSSRPARGACGITGSHTGLAAASSGSGRIAPGQRGRIVAVRPLGLGLQGPR